MGKGGKGEFIGGEKKMKKKYTKDRSRQKQKGGGGKCLRKEARNNARMEVIRKCQ